MPRLTIQDFLQDDSGAPILDARAPLEYAQGHIPGAVSFPLFSDEERARIGTMYKQVNPDKAVLLGLDLFGPKMSRMVQQAQKLAPGKQVRLHCWRGGMRSGAVQWLLELAGFQVQLLDKGYKEYRRWVLQEFERPRPLLVLGGLTGSGKTAVLHALSARQPVLDLEGLASHKGSAFGSIGQPSQPTQEQFENDLALQLAHMEAEKPVWVEDESRTIGSVHVPPPLFQQMQQAPLVLLEIPREVRVRKLAEEYGRQDAGALASSVLRIRKRLGGLATKEALAAIAEDDMEKMVSLVLDYYDKTYSHGLSGRPAVRVPSDTCDAAVNAELVLAAAQKNWPAAMLNG
ncbi:tRNA 2-selenouridine(34) synthase MnmH [Hymenobacter psychrotolerans]|uniref:tRNA 2-selenouridine synthase n=1 Tax=Hymenobacter psychrotolerans DSM 18569 TaxID=1121959 RepID=A0A1M6P2T5_9BACT|nr:tRNA 2-selenouridine(34) synthase MnmH [Hymenobacter psychrotolerans]SHK02236.1 tRNA 2-selenouridine synthase [Hymenobacter psychrotolerans DSM 18569]